MFDNRLLYSFLDTRNVAKAIMFRFILILGITYVYTYAVKSVCIGRNGCGPVTTSTTKDLFSKIGVRETILGRFLPPTNNPLYENCKCSSVYNPVCGTNNQSYYNPCYLTCGLSNVSVEIKHFGKCLPF
ncbi:PREDICTED: serine protease inhibitor dipetalogastin-like [Papilio xuthus]|uniref:Serine protease inhibitor dipetalogastin-like n=1 Tax=Papilio xuthus TaxID=66420 RepID=A0AAJ7E9U6_PAPXU|nr:PREDICTED: serine protease inhibitor dipetalogastin-like [Papilio xuthus]